MARNCIRKSKLKGVKMREMLSRRLRPARRCIVRKFLRQSMRLKPGETDRRAAHTEHTAQRTPERRSRNSER